MEGSIAWGASMKLLLPNSSITFLSHLACIAFPPTSEAPKRKSLLHNGAPAQMLSK